jgi:hypothetical protein
MVSGLYGCLESSFELAADSRLPNWIEVQDGASRRDYRLTLDCYSTFSGGEFVFKLYKKGSFFKIQKATADLSRIKEIVQDDSLVKKDKYPKYFAVTIDGIVDIVELRKMEPVFYMTELGSHQK